MFPCVLFILLCMPLSSSSKKLRPTKYDMYDFNIDSGFGRTFDGVGAISGGGATSKLLVNYPSKVRSDVLDYLFKPSFGASLHILKVEIGGDDQSSDGTESSHMHNEWDENYERGYEWWLMKEAKKRNPKIKLCGLPWSFPGWLGDGNWWPYMNNTRTALYIIKWIKGAAVHHNLTIDYVGIWNEKPYTVEYIIELRKQLDNHGLRHVQIVAADLIGSDAWNIADDMAKNKALNNSVNIIGGHYTGTWTTDTAQSLGHPIWSSEDYSYYDNENGAGCLARIINQNYVNGLMTSTIAWNAIASYYDELDFKRHSLMTANQPWSGHYTVSPPVWIAAHTTQFAQPNWKYLRHNSGVGLLKHGGSYVSLYSPDNKDFTIIIETIDAWDHDVCVQIPYGPYKVAAQNVTLRLLGKLANITRFNVWYSHLGFGQQPSTFFQEKGSVKVVNGTLRLNLEVNSVYTLTTVNSGHKGSHGTPPSEGKFPLPYTDNFEKYNEFSEAFNLAQQVGVFEIRNVGGPNHNKVIRQVVLQRPIFWCPIAQTQPTAVIGNYSWSDIQIESDVRIPSINSSSGAYVATRVNKNSCTTLLTQGIFFFLLQNSLVISTDLVRANIVYTKTFNLKQDTWYHMSLHVKGNHTTAVLDSKTIFSGDVVSNSRNGFAALGSDSFGLADFDNLHIQES